MTTRRTPLVIKRMRPARAALAAGVATTLLTITFIVALVSFTQTQTADAIRSALSRPDNLAVTMSGSLSAQQQPQARAAILGNLRRAFGTVPFSLFGSLRVDGLALLGGGPAKPAGRTHHIVTVVGPDALAAHATLITGRWPRPRRRAGRCPSRSRRGGRPAGRVRRKDHHHQVPLRQQGRDAAGERHLPAR